MAPASGVCEVCGLEEFSLEAGFYYCNECGTKLQTQREFIEDGDGTTEGPSTGVQEANVSGNKITSWEVVNYILCGLTDRLITLGAPPELKSTVLQIWCAYLRESEIAFFSKGQRLRPRLSLYNQKSDLNLVFNRALPKPRSRSKKKSDKPSTTRSKRKLNQQLLEEEHDTLVQSQSCDLESTLGTLSSSLYSSNATDGPIPFQFNSKARKRMKTELNIEEEHIVWHEQEAPVDAPCHSITVLNPSKRISHSQPDDWSHFARKSVIISILILGLNQIRSFIQTADISRWIDEGHLPLCDLKQFLPDDLDPACYSETLIHLSSFNLGECYSNLSSLTRDLGIMPVEPDLAALCRRFLGELALPLDLEPYISKLIAIGPAIERVTTNFPIYDQHAMKYILFVMKLLFGLDGVVERKLDAASEKLNTRISTADAAQAHLFVWDEWQKYVTMRRTILEQLHYPTNYQRANTEVRGNTNNELFLDFVSSSLIPDDDNTTGYRAAIPSVKHGQWEERRFKNTHSIITSATDKEREELEASAKKHICFDHSLQSQRSYLAAVMKMEEAERPGVYIPDYMRTDHCKRTVIPFVNPMPLKTYLLDRRRVKLITKAMMPPTSHIRMVNVRQHNTNVELYMDSTELTKVIQVDDTDESDHEGNILDFIEARAESRLPSHEELFHKVTCRNTLDHLQSELMDSINDAHELMADPTDKKQNPSKSIPPIKKTLPGEEHCNETVKIILSNFHYWVRGITVEDFPPRLYEVEYFPNFPYSFQFLLREAARVLRCPTADIYRKLVELENHFFKIIQP